MGRCGGFHACAAALPRGDGEGDGADAAAVLWAGSSKKASLTDVARALTSGLLRPRDPGAAPADA